MQTEMPIFDCPEDALRACVQALGGAKKVGPMLWPDKTVENAARLLLDCLNGDRPEKLGYSQQIFIFRESKRIGFHAGFAWWAAEVEYDIHPISPEEKRDRLADAIETASRALEMAVKEAHQMTTVKRVA